MYGIVLCMTKNQTQPVDLSIFAPIVDKALEEFRDNVKYTEAMIKRARTIIHKRTTGQKKRPDA